MSCITHFVEACSRCEVCQLRLAYQLDDNFGSGCLIPALVSTLLTCE